MGTLGFNEKQSDSSRLDPAPIGKHLVELSAILIRKIKDPQSTRTEGEPFFKIQYKIIVGKPDSKEVFCSPGDLHEQCIFMDKVGKTNTDLSYLYAAAVAAEHDLTNPFPIANICMSPENRVGRKPTPASAPETKIPGFKRELIEKDDEKILVEFFHILEPGVTTEIIRSAIAAKMTIICVEQMLLSGWLPSQKKYLNVTRGLIPTKKIDPTTQRPKEFPTHRWQPMTVEVRSWVESGGIEKLAAARAEAVIRAMSIQKQE